MMLAWFAASETIKSSASSERGDDAEVGEVPRGKEEGGGGADEGRQPGFEGEVNRGLSVDGGARHRADPDS